MKNGERKREKSERILQLFALNFSLSPCYESVLQFIVTRREYREFRPDVPLPQFVQLADAVP